MRRWSQSSLHLTQITCELSQPQTAHLCDLRRPLPPIVPSHRSTVYLHLADPLLLLLPNKHPGQARLQRVAPEPGDSNRAKQWVQALRYLAAGDGNLGPGDAARSAPIDSLNSQDKRAHDKPSCFGAVPGAYATAMQLPATRDPTRSQTAGRDNLDPIAACEGQPFPMRHERTERCRKLSYWI